MIVPRTISSVLIGPSGHRVIFTAVIAILFLLTGCAETGQMRNQPRYDPLEPSNLFADGRSARALVPGTVAYANGQPVDSPLMTGMDENGSPYQGFPAAVTQEQIKLGQERYNIYCIPCHGPGGQGDGKVISFGFGKPPSLLDASAKGLANGELFNIITNGKGKMFPYGYRVKAPERWAVIAYIRALQLKMERSILGI